MHEDTQRRLMRGAFLLLCVLPTVVILGAAVFRSLPMETRRLERSLRDQLGLDVTIQRLSHPRPHQLRLETVVVQDPETQRALISIPWVDATLTPSGWRLRFEHAELDAHGLPTLWHAWLHRVLPLEQHHVRLASVAGQALTVRIAASSQTLHHPTWRQLSDSNDHRSLLQFQLADDNASPVRISLDRDREGTPAVTRLVLDTGTNSLPLALVAAAAGRTSETAMMLRGRLPIEWRGADWSANFTGLLSEIDLAAWAVDWLPHPLQGLAELQVERAELTAAGLQSVRSRITVQELSLSSLLLQALIKYKVFEPGPGFALPEAGGPFQAERLELELVSLGDNGLICRAPLDNAGLRIAVSGPHGPVLLSNGHLRVEYLIRAMIPETVENAYAIAARWTDLLPPTLPQLERR